MIVRITEGIVAPGREADFSEVARSRERELGAAPGIVSVHVGRRLTEEGTEFVFVTLWRTFEDLAAAAADPEATSRMARGHPELFTRVSARHFETFG